MSSGNIETLAGADTVTLAAGSSTTGITIDLGAGDDRLDLASVNFGTLDGGENTDTLSITATGITLEGGTVSNFETLIFAAGAGSNTLSGTHTGLISTRFEAGTTTLTGSLTSTTAAVSSGAMLDLAAGSSLAGDLANSGSLNLAAGSSLAGDLANSGSLNLAAGSSLADLSNSGMLTVAGSSFGSTTITGSLTLNAGGILTLDTNGAGGETDLLTVTGAVTLDGTLALRQTTMPDGMVVLIDGASLTGAFAEDSITGLISAPLISQVIAYDGPSGQVRLVTTVMAPEPDSGFPTGCVVTPTPPLADGGTLTCISATPITEAIATSVDGVTIIIGESATQTTVMTGVGVDALSASIAGDSAAGNISINTEFGTIFGTANGISATNAGTGGISITTADVTGTANRGIYASLSNSAATGDIMIDSSGGTVMGNTRGIFADNVGTGGISITTAAASVSGTDADGIYASLNHSNALGDLSVTATGAVSGNRYGILAQRNGGGTLSVDASMVGAIGGSGEGDAGIFALSGGSGAISVTNTGSGGSGSRAISIASTGVVSGAAGGISATHTGDGAITITAVSVTGNAGSAISATTAGGAIGISGADTVLGTGGRGIEAISGGGDISVQGVGATGGVSGTTGHGIFANANGGGNINIGGSGDDALGAITGGGTGNSGINALTDGVGRSITIDASGGTVAGDSRGIHAVNAGTEAASISITTADVTGTANRGIYASLSNSAATGDIMIDSSGGTVMGNTRGIFADNVGTGGISITTAAASVSGTDADGIYASLNHSNALGDLSVTATGAVSGNRYGILAQRNGGGTLSVDASMVGAIGGSGEGDAGIFALSGGSGAISVANTGSGGSGSRAISIASTGVVSGAAGGISATHTGDGAITITAVSVTGNAGSAISATTAGGAIGISGADTVLGTGGRGIEATSGGGDISVQGVGATGGVSGTAGHGIFTNANGGGNINIGGSGDDALGAITGGGTGNSGINALTDGVGRSITMVAGDSRGIHAVNAGTEAASISIMSATATGMISDGIYASLSNSAATGDLSIIATGAVSGGRHGIEAQQNGSGTLTIDASIAGAIGGTDEGDVGIFATSAGSGAITVRNAGSGETGSRAISIASSGAVSGAVGGIAATHTGDGAISITAASVTGNAGSGISATTAGGDISITASGTVMGSNSGIFVINPGSGTTSLTVSDVSASGGSGILTRQLPGRLLSSLPGAQSPARGERRYPNHAPDGVRLHRRIVSLLAAL